MAAWGHGWPWLEGGFYDVYIYISIYVGVCIYIYVCRCMYIYICICMCVYMYVCVYTILRGGKSG